MGGLNNGQERCHILLVTWHISTLLNPENNAEEKKDENIGIHLSVVFCQSILIFEKFLAVSLKNLHTS